MHNEKPVEEKRYGWLASLVAVTIITLFRLIESILKLIFSILSSIARYKKLTPQLLDTR